MANTYTQLYIHFVFAVKGRQSLIPREHKDELQKYITGIVKNKKHKLLATENEPDHIHILVGLKSDQSISDLVKDIKTGSSLWLNEQSWMIGHLAGRLRRIFLFPVATRSRDRIHSKSGSASQEAKLPRGIHRHARGVWNRV